MTICETLTHNLPPQLRECPLLPDAECPILRNNKHAPPIPRLAEEVVDYRLAVEAALHGIRSGHYDEVLIIVEDALHKHGYDS